MVTETESLISLILTKIDIKIISKLENWGKIVQLYIDNEPYFIKFQNKLDLIKGQTDTPDFSISSTFITFEKILNGTINPVEAVVSGEVSIEGSLTAALEFSEIINEAETIHKKK